MTFDGGTQELLGHAAQRFSCARSWARTDMTSCLLLKSPTRLAVVADGRLTHDQGNASLNRAQKIRSFKPRCHVPRVAMGRLSSFEVRESSIWYVAYAGTYALASEIIEKFTRRVSNLYLDREDGEPCLRSAFDQSRSFLDNYNFQHDEILEISVADIIMEAKDAFQTLGDEWMRNRHSISCEILIFGMDKGASRFRTRLLKADQSFWHRDGQIRIDDREIADSEIAAIGSLQVATSAHDDEELAAGIAGWADPNLDTLFSETEAWSADQVAHRFASHIRSTDDVAVGGELLLATGSAGGPIQIRLLPG